MCGQVVVPAFPKGAEQAVGAGGYGRRRRPWRAIVNERSFYLPYCEAVMAELQTRMRSIHPSITYSISIKNADTIKDGTEDANHNGKIDGDNGDGIFENSEIWIETDPNNEDSDGDSFNDNQEKSWGYNPNSIDTDRDGIEDNIEDSNGNGIRDGSETSAKKEDTDGDGLPDLIEKEGWNVIVVEENTKRIITNKNVVSDPNVKDYDGDGLNDLSEYLNGTDPNDSNTDNDEYDDYEEVTNDMPTLPWGIDGKPPVITKIDFSYETKYSGIGKLKVPTGVGLTLEGEAYDAFGLEWIKIEITDFDPEKIFTGDVKTYSIDEDWSISYDKAVSALFDGFDLKITAMDVNYNIGESEKHLDGLVNYAFNFVPSTINRIINIFIEEWKECIKTEGTKNKDILQSGFIGIGAIGKGTISVMSNSMRNKIESYIEVIGLDDSIFINYIKCEISEQIIGIIKDIVNPSFVEIKHYLISQKNELVNKDISIEIPKDILLSKLYLKEIYNRFLEETDFSVIKERLGSIEEVLNICYNISIPLIMIEYISIYDIVEMIISNLNKAIGNDDDSYKYIIERLPMIRMIYEKSGINSYLTNYNIDINKDDYNSNEDNNEYDYIEIINDTKEETPASFTSFNIGFGVGFKDILYIGVSINFIFRLIERYKHYCYIKGWDNNNTPNNKEDDTIIYEGGYEYNERENRIYSLLFDAPVAIGWGWDLGVGIGIPYVSFGIAWGSKTGCDFSGWSNTFLCFNQDVQSAVEGLQNILLLGLPMFDRLNKEGYISQVMTSVGASIGWSSEIYNDYDGPTYSQPQLIDEN